MNLVVLDWYLNQEDSTDAEVFLDAIRDFTFAPIIIFTAHSRAGVQEFIDGRGLHRIATVLDKADVNGDMVFNALVKWLSDNPELKIFLAWSFEVESKLNDSLWSVYDLDKEGFRYVVDAIQMRQDGSHIPEEYEVTSLLTRVLSRRLGSSAEFRARLKTLLDSLRGTPKGESGSDILLKIAKLRTLELYVEPPVSEPIWTGDVLYSSNGVYHIVVTPVCDLCNPGKIERVTMVKAVPFEAYRLSNLVDEGEEARKVEERRAKECVQHRKTSIHHLPYFTNSPGGLVCLFDCVTSEGLDDLLLKIKKGEIARVATIDSPFIEHLVQRMNSYLMRMGIRDLSEVEIRSILKTTKPAKLEGSRTV